MTNEAFLKEAAVEDARQIWEWRNDPHAVAASLNRSEVGWEEHRRWYENVLDDPTRHLLILQSADEALGMVRLDHTGDSEAEVSVNIAPAYRGQGLGILALKLALVWARDNGSIKTVIARVRTDNHRSLRAFAAAGFEEVDRKDGIASLVQSGDP